MSKRVKSVLALSLVLVLSLTLAACNGGGPATSTVPTQTEPTQVDAAQLVAQASSATSAVDTSKFDMNMTMVMEVVGGTDPGKMTILFNAKGAMDNKDREMILATDMNMDIPGQGAQAAITEFYAVGDWIYIKMSVPGS
ncbi:MAG: hypothetical protein FJ025_04420, partial [Chloroflexi bacterium]|nr:hypothetical protein [Chloroflexota bacterium]